MITYLASPYSPSNGESIEARERLAAIATVRLMQLGHAVFSPIVHSHRLADLMPEHLRFDHEFWMQQDLRILERCELLVVLMLPGWEKSAGVAREIAFAKHNGIPVMYTGAPTEDDK